MGFSRDFYPKIIVLFYVCVLEFLSFQCFIFPHNFICEGFSVFISIFVVADKLLNQLGEIIPFAAIGFVIFLISIANWNISFLFNFAALAKNNK